MEIEFSEEKYQNMLAKLFVRFPSFQKDGASAYKPGIAKMEFMNEGREVAFTQADGKIMLTDKVETEEEYSVFKLYKK